MLPYVIGIDRVAKVCVAVVRAMLAVKVHPDLLSLVPPSSNGGKYRGTRERFLYV